MENNAEGKVSPKYVEVLDLAARINEFQKKLDPEYYGSFYPDSKLHEEKIAMQLLVEKGKREYQSWLQEGDLTWDPELSKEAEGLLQVLEGSEIKYPANMEPFVYIGFSEDAGLENGDVIPISEADTLFGSLDHRQCLAKKDNDELGYNKVFFEILFLHEDELCTYSGRQDMGDGEGNLFQHMEACQDHYLNTERGQKELEFLPEEEAESLINSCLYVKKELLPTLRYFCNLSKIERAILEEWQLNSEIPIKTEQQEAREKYHEGVLRFIEESRQALNSGGVLPQMPDIRDYTGINEKKSYREHVMEEIQAEAKEYGMTLDEYAQNGYEPRNKKR